MTTLARRLTGLSRGFDPASITGLMAWWDFADVTSLWKDTARTSAVTADGDAIKGVSDKSGGGRHLSEATNGPTYKTGIQNGQSVARFDGTNDWLSSAVASFAFGSGATVFLAGAQTTPGTTDYFMYSVSADTMLFNAGTNRQMVFGGLANVGYATTQSANFISDTWRAYAAIWDTTLATHEANIYAGGTASALWPNNANNTGSLTPTRLSLGATFTPGGFLHGDIGEVIIYNAALTNAQINSAAGYLAAKWSLAWTAI